MKLKPGCQDEYKRRHDAIWPELILLLKQQGIYNYTIFLEEQTNRLFAVQEVSGNSSSQDLSNTAIVQKWWQYMADIMDVHPDNSLVSIPLKEVFHLD